MTNNRRKRAERAEQARLAREREEKRRRLFVTAGIIGAVLLVIGLAALAINSGDDEESGPVVVPKSLTEDGGIVYDQQAAVGKSSGEATPVEVVLFVDYQCPICKVFEESTGDYLDRQVESGAISIEYRPQSFLDRASKSEYSSRALGAAMCVNEDKGAKAFKDFSDILFVNQPAENSEGLPDSRLVTYAEQAGAPEAKACITKRTYHSWAKTTEESMGDNKDAGGTKVDSTPTIWIDGKAVNGPEQNGRPGVARLQDIRKALSAAQA